jgi:hypothetical protein
LQLITATRQQTFDQSGLCFLQVEDSLFNGGLADKLVNENGLGLANTMCAVAGLCFSGGIPPWIVVNDGVSGGKCQA